MQFFMNFTVNKLIYFPLRMNWVGLQILKVGKKKFK